MAHFVQETGKNASKLVTSTSRYSKSKLIFYTENKLLTFELYKKQPIYASNNDKWMEITPAVEYRPDLVSFEVYSTPDFWWKIMELNGMKDILEFKAGRNIRVNGNVF